MAIAARSSAGGQGAAEANPELAEFCENAGAWVPLWPRLKQPKRKASIPASRYVHPFDPEWLLPVYVANFVLMDYGTGAIFGCPSGDQRDLDFANKYGLPVTPVVMPDDGDAATFQVTEEAMWTTAS